MERPIEKAIGTPVEKLDTPALIVDLSRLDQNLQTVHSFFEGSSAKLRPYVGTHRTPDLAHRQLALGGTVGGVAVGTVGQAEVFIDSGIDDVMITTEVVMPSKIARVCNLARQAIVTVPVDNLSNVDDLSESAIASNVNLKVVVDVHTGLNGCGVEPGKPAVDLAKYVCKAKGLEFVGFYSYEGANVGKNEVLRSQSRKWIQMILDTREEAEKAGLEIQTVVVGGTHNYDIAAGIDGVTEIPAGTYALLDERYREQRPELQPAASVIATVSSVPESSLAVADAGMKSCGNDTGLPIVENRPDLTVTGLSAEHTSILADKTERPLQLGDKLWLTPWEIAVTCNLYDYMNGVRDGKLETVFNVTARGRYR